MDISLQLSKYISRYAPSKKKIYSYLEKKKYTENIPILLEKIGYDESSMCRIWISYYISLSRGYTEIREKLLHKGFGRDSIAEGLQWYQRELEDWEAYRYTIERLIEGLLSKGKSKRMITSLLIKKYPHFHDNIYELMRKNDDKIILEKEIEKKLRKYDIQNRQKRILLYQSLMRKGFSSRDIDDILQEKVSRGG